MAIMHVENSLFCSDSHLKHLVRLLVFFFFFASYHNWFLAYHIEGKHNTTADVLSRNDLHTFFLQAPQASHTPSQIWG